MYVLSLITYTLVRASACLVVMSDGGAHIVQRASHWRFFIWSLKNLVIIKQKSPTTLSAFATFLSYSEQTQFCVVIIVKNQMVGTNRGDSLKFSLINVPLILMLLLCSKVSVKCGSQNQKKKKNKKKIIIKKLLKIIYLKKKERKIHQ